MTKRGRRTAGAAASVDPLALDRRLLPYGTDGQPGAPVRLSDLRDVPYLVVLGEPGMGKSTVLAAEARREGTKPITVRAVMNGTAAPEGPTLYLDGLDEYRMDGSGPDKTYQLAARIADDNWQRWRLGCRAEDWRASADNIVLSAAAQSQLTVVQLLPLDETEQLSVLRTLGEADPAAFLTEAKRQHAEPLLENPLSLRLLRKAVSADGKWPQGRFALYDRATRTLAHEHNDMRQSVRDRTPVPAILAAAERANLFLLASGARALWRSAGPPPEGSDARAVVDASFVADNPREVGDMLDTPLFTGEGHQFEPMHRTIAEFLGARALARAVTGGDGRAALPLSRAVALITAPDGKAPSELRGLYAWLAAHLAVMGFASQARELAERDPLSTLVYGDAAVFDLPTRQAMLANLGRDDPYFLGFDVGATTLGALATDDLARDLIGVLQHPEDNHRLAAVFEILRAGPVLAAVQPVLHAIILDPDREAWHRSRALLIWLAGEPDGDAARRALFERLGGQPSTIARETLRGELLAGMSDAALTDADIFAVLDAYGAAPGTSAIGNLYALQRRLTDTPRASLLEDSRWSWEADAPEPPSNPETSRVLNEVFAAAVTKTERLDAARLWRWMKNLSGGDPGELDHTASRAVAGWLAVDPAREIALFEAIVDEDPPSQRPHIEYAFAVGRPGTGLTRSLMKVADAEKDKARQDRLIASIVDIVRDPNSEAGLPDIVRDWLATIPARAADLDRLVRKVPADEPRRPAPRSRPSEKKEETRHAEEQRLYGGRVAAIRSGADEEALFELVATYFTVPGKDGDGSDGRSRLGERLGDDLAEAVLAGYEAIATAPPRDTAFEIGNASGDGQTLLWAGAALPGVDRLLATNPERIEVAPPALALAVYGVSGAVVGSERKRAIQAWAARQLDRDPVAGAATLVEMWEGLIAADDSEYSAIWVWPSEADSVTAVPLALEIFLRTHPGTAFAPLRILMTAAAKRLSLPTLEALARAALATEGLPAAAKSLWSLLLFAIVGDRNLLAGHAKGQIEALIEKPHGDELLEVVPLPSALVGAERAAAVIRILGPLSSPEQSRPSGGRSMRAAGKSDAVHAALRAMSANPDPAAGRLLDECLAEDGLAAWRGDLLHTREQQRRLARDAYHGPPTPAVIASTLSGAAPANAADLRAIIVDEGRRLAREMQTDANSPWRFYWNNDEHSRAVDPLNENLARDLTFTLLKARVEKYHIAAVMPEAQHVNDTRADVLILSAAGRSLPIEAKRHYHKDLWNAAAGQLQGYAAAPDADGNGILLALWYGNDVAPTPPRADKKQKPSTAAELEAMLKADLPEAIRDRTDVIVLDVSAPPGKRAPKARAARAAPRPKVAAKTIEAAKAPANKAVPAKKT